MVWKCKLSRVFQPMVIVILSGCQAFTASQTVYAYETIKPGTILTLQRSIEFPADKATLRIQYGEIQHGQFSLDPYRPNCRLELRVPPTEPMLIEPDQFTIYKVSYDIDYVLKQNTMVAGLGFQMSNAVSDEIYTTVLHLRSEKQPQVQLLSCQHWEDPSDFTKHLTLNQIKQALAGMMTIQTP